MHQVELWAQTELVLARVYEAIAGSLEDQLVARKREIPELTILIALFQFHGSRRMDESPYLYTYAFDLVPGERFEVSFEDSEPRRRRAETWYDRALEAMGHLFDAERKQKEPKTLVRLTWVLTILTIFIAILACATLWVALASG